MHCLFDLLGDILGDAVGFNIIDIFRFNDNTNFATRLDGIALLDTFEPIGNCFEGLETLDVLLEILAAGTRTGTGDGISRFSNDRFTDSWSTSW